jgi:hypothetical protein
MQINKKSRTLENSTLLNYAYLVLLLTQGFLSQVLGIGGMFSAVMVLLGLSVFFAINSKYSYLNLMKTTPIVFWTLWVCYNFINWKLVGLYNEEGSPLQFILSRFVYPIVTMSIVYYEGGRNMKRTTLVVLVALAIYVFGGLFLEGVVQPAKQAWEDSERGETSLGNHLPLTACIMAFFSIIASVKGWISKPWLFGLLAVSFAAIVYIATRKALMGWCLIVVMSLFTGFDLRKPSNFFKFLLLIGIFFLGYHYVMEDTYLGERIVDTHEQGEESNESDVEALNFLGDRAMQYYLAWELFLEHPITGIGLRNFSIMADFPLVLHSEYMVQLCECGIIGSVLYLLFMGGLIIKTVRLKRSNARLFYICLGGILCMLFINFTAWTYQGNAYFAMYGLILATYYHETKYDEPTRNKRKYILR